MKTTTAPRKERRHQPIQNPVFEPASGLPAGIERQLSDLELRHKRHQEKMEAQRLAILDRRDRHRRGVHKLKHTAQTLV